LNDPSWKPWGDRSSKAICYSSLTNIRRIFYNIALLRPDIFDAKWIQGNNVAPLNPASNEDLSPGDPADKFYRQSPSNNTLTGFVEHLLHSRIEQGADVDVSGFKYTVVLLGRNGNACADRLDTYLLRSGSVILLQEGTCEYHYSMRLKPWVHYVPITYSAADVADKVDWLIAHDDIAQRIARNGFNFGRSFLRLEDSFCYIATALNTLGTIMNSTNAATKYFNATHIRENHDTIDEKLFLN